MQTMLISMGRDAGTRLCATMATPIICTTVTSTTRMEIMSTSTSSRSPARTPRVAPPTIVAGAMKRVMFMARAAATRRCRTATTWIIVLPAIFTIRTATTAMTTAR
jgi:hypothetical protein